MVTLRGAKDRRKSATVTCGGPSCEGCGESIEVRFTNAQSDTIGPIEATEIATDRHGWTSDFPAWHTMMVGISHLCPACSTRAAVAADPCADLDIDPDDEPTERIERPILGGGAW